MDLSEGALATIMNGGQIDEPIMQILGSKKISGAGDNERYRLLVSDGVHVNSFAMLATQLNDKIRNGDLADNTIVRIKRYITSVVPNSGKGEKRVMIILDVEVVSPGNEVGSRIGNPVSWTPDGQAQPAAAPSRPANGPTSSSNSAPPAPAPRPQPPQLSPAKAPAAANGGNRGGFGGGYANNIRSPARGMGGMGGPELTPNSHSHPIASLTPYQNKWVIKARVTGKGPIRSWQNAKGEGTLFSFDVVDESGEIRVTAFREQCTKFYDMIEVGKVYLITRGNLKTANKKFSNLNNDYEINLSNETQILPLHDDDAGVPQIKFNFVPLDEIEKLEQYTLVDVIGVVTEPGEVTTIVSKASNKEFKKRDVTIVDKTSTAVHLTLWGSQAEEFDGSNQPVVAVKGGKVNEFGGGKSVSLPASATFQVNPDIPESHQLKGWYDDDGSGASFKLISQRTLGGGTGNDGELLTIKEAREKGLGSNGKPDYYLTKATIIMIKSENAMYNACPGENCNKKVIDQQNGLYRCEKCNREYPNYKPRLLLSMNVGDWSDNSWVTLFQETAEAVLEQTSENLDEMKINNPEAYQQVFQQATFKSFVFKMRAQLQAYNDENRLKTNVVVAKKIDHKAYCESLLTQLKEIEGMGEA